MIKFLLIKSFVSACVYDGFLISNPPTICCGFKFEISNLPATGKITHKDKFSGSQVILPFLR